MFRKLFSKKKKHVNKHICTNKRKRKDKEQGMWGARAKNIIQSIFKIPENGMVSNVWALEFQAAFSDC